MYPPLADIYAVVLQLEREKEVLRLSEKARFLRDAKVVTFSRSKLNLKKLLKIFNRERVRQGEAASISFKPGAVCCTTSKTVQCQPC